MANLQGKVVLVTGGSRGIGAEIARRFAFEGAHVSITFVNQSVASEAVIDDIHAYGRKGLLIQSDAADSAAIAEGVDKVIQEFGHIDILVNNAGHYQDMSETLLQDIPLEAVNQTIMVNIRAAFLYAQAAAPHFREGGRIINISSCIAGRVPSHGLTLYAMSKAAITGLTKGLARDFAGRGITVNQISPGPIDTDMSPANAPNSDFFRNLTALGRFGTTSDIAAIASFLASDEANFITGANIAVDGGANI